MLVRPCHYVTDAYCSPPGGRPGPITVSKNLVINDVCDIFVRTIAWIFLLMIPKFTRSLTIDNHAKTIYQASCGFIVHWNNYSEWLEKLHAVVGLEMRWLKRSNSIIQHIAWFHLTLTVYHCSFCPLHVLVVINLNLLNL